MNLRTNLFTSGAIDNIDHDPSSNTAQSSFHGTSISIHQHCSLNEGLLRDQPVLLDSETNAIGRLPEDYVVIAPFYRPVLGHAAHPYVVKEQEFSVEPHSQKAELEWMQYVSESISAGEPELVGVSWAAFDARNSESIRTTPDITALLPLFRELLKSESDTNCMLGPTTLCNSKATPVE